MARWQHLDIAGMPCKGSQCPAVALCGAGGMIRPARIGKPAAGPLGLAGCAGTAGPGPAGQIVAVCFSAVLLLLVPLLFVFLLCYCCAECHERNRYI